LVVLKTKPTFSSISGISSVLINGENRLYGFTVTPDSAGMVSFGRLVFEINSNMAYSNFSNFTFWREVIPLGSEAEIQTVESGGNLYVIVSFNQERGVAAGATMSFYLDATVTGAVVDSIVTTSLLTDNQSVTGLSAVSTCGPSDDQLCSTGNGNTGRIFDTGADEALFDTAEAFSQGLNFSRVMIWSDMSADAHAYPTMNSGVVTAGTGSYDWTNGWGLAEPELHTLEY
jgi:hypothetical protein